MGHIKMLTTVTVSALCMSMMRVCAQAWSPDLSTIKKLEAGIQPGDFPGRSGIPGNIEGYARYYAGDTDNGHRVISGEFLRLNFGEGAAGIHILSDRRKFPVIFDGGCGVINFVYDLDSGKILSVRCNGVA